MITDKKLRELLNEKKEIVAKTKKTIEVAGIRLADTTEKTPFPWFINSWEEVGEKPKTIVDWYFTMGNPELEFLNLHQKERWTEKIVEGAYSKFIEYFSNHGFLINEKSGEDYYKNSPDYEYGEYLINWRYYSANIPAGKLIKIKNNPEGGEGFTIIYNNAECHYYEIEDVELVNIEEKDIKININKDIWAKETYIKLIKRNENKFEENRCFQLKEIAENLYEENLKSYANTYIDLLMSDDYFAWDGAPTEEIDRALEIYYFLFDPMILGDPENGIRTNDEFFEMVEDVINSCREIRNEKEEEFVDDLLWTLHVIDLQEGFLSKYEGILK